MIFILLLIIFVKLLIEILRNFDLRFKKKFLGCSGAMKKINGLPKKNFAKNIISTFLFNAQDFMVILN